MSQIDIVLTEHDLRLLVKKHIEEITNLEIKETEIQIETKSTQNFRSEWERAQYRARFHRNV